MSNEIVKIDEMPAISSDSLIAMAEQAGKRIEAVKAIKQTSLKVTNENDWVDQNGKPYLQASGGEKIARLFGISWTIDEPTIEYEESGHFTYTYKGVFSLANASIEAIGTRSSKDGFFKKYEWENGVKKELPVSAISKDDVKKSAYTNLIGNGITRLLGIRNLTYDDLKISGIDVTKITKVEYKKSGKPPTAPPQENTVKGQIVDITNVETGIAKIIKSEGVNKKTGQAFSLFKIFGEGEKVYTTFSESFATLAKTAHDAGLKVHITHKNDTYNTIEKIDLIEPLEDIPKDILDERL